MYGIGDGSLSNTRLIGQIRALAESREKLPTLGISRRFVTDHFALENVRAQLQKYCQAAVAKRQRRLVAVANGLRSAAYQVSKSTRRTASVSWSKTMN
jgi:hypothetical protein